MDGLSDGIDEVTPATSAGEYRPVAGGHRTFKALALGAVDPIENDQLSGAAVVDQQGAADIGQVEWSGGLVDDDAKTWTLRTGGGENHASFGLARHPHRRRTTVDGT